jgi:hypothetical protein
MQKPRSKDQTAISISLSKGLLAEIDDRVKTLGLSRSQFLAQIARKNIDQGGPLVIPAADTTQPSRIVDLKAEIIEFLKIALMKYESYKKQKSAVPEPPEPLAETELWLRFVDELDEIAQHKWIESEKAGDDIGADRAIREWLQKHHALWVAAQEPLIE